MNSKEYLEMLEVLDRKDIDIAPSILKLTSTLLKYIIKLEERVKQLEEGE